MWTFTEKPVSLCGDKRETLIARPYLLGTSSCEQIHMQGNSLNWMLLRVKGSTKPDKHGACWSYPPQLHLQIIKFPCLGTPTFLKLATQIYSLILTLRCDSFWRLIIKSQLSKHQGPTIKNPSLSNVIRMFTRNLPSHSSLF